MTDTKFFSCIATDRKTGVSVTFYGFNSMIAHRKAIEWLRSI